MLLLLLHPEAVLHLQLLLELCPHVRRRLVRPHRVLWSVPTNHLVWQTRLDWHLLLLLLLHVRRDLTGSHGMLLSHDLLTPRRNGLLRCPWKPCLRLLLLLHLLGHLLLGDNRWHLALRRRNLGHLGLPRLPIVCFIFLLLNLLSLFWWLLFLLRSFLLRLLFLRWLLLLLSRWCLGLLYLLIRKRVRCRRLL